jgi:hypothetical protein
VSTGRAAWLRQQHLACLVDDEDTTGGALWCLLQSNSRDECLGGVAEECVRQLLLGFECRVRLGAIVGQTKDVEARCSEGRERVAEEADLGGACDALECAGEWLARAQAQAQTYILASRPWGM